MLTKEEYKAQVSALIDRLKEKTLRAIDHQNFNVDLITGIHGKLYLDIQIGEETKKEIFAI